MTRYKYLEMMEQLCKEPIEEESPPDFEDLPDIVNQAVSTFNNLGDRVYPEIGYIGKDYINLPFFLDMYDIDDTEFFLEILSWLDSRAVKQSSEQLKRQYEQLKRKSRG